MTDPTPEELDALQTSLRNLGGHGFPNWADDADKAITALRDREALIEAAVIERAIAACNAEYLDGETHEETDMAYDRAVADCLSAVRALTKPGARTLLDQRIAEAEKAGYERGLREAQAKNGDTK